MPNATFSKDNAAVKDGDETKGSKGDFIFHDKEDGVEYISIMFDMKNESDDAVNKKKNSDFFDKLDKDRKKKYDEAIKGIDTTIETLSKIKESLRISANHLTAANNKAYDLTIRKLTYNNPTVKAGIEEARVKKAQQELEQDPDEQ